MNLIKIDVASPGSGLSPLYKGKAEVALLTHPNLVSLFDPAYVGYQTLNSNGKFQVGANVRQPGASFQPRSSADADLVALTSIDGMPIVDKSIGSPANNNWKDSYSFPAGDFCYFGAFAPSSGAGQNGYLAGTYDNDGVTVGIGTDYKPRVYTRYGTGSVLSSATADVVEGRLSLYVMQYTYSDNRVRLWVDGTLRINSTSAPSVTQTTRRLVVGSGYFYDTSPHDPSGTLKGKIAFGGVMAGAHPSFEPTIRAFAKERFPAGLSHAL